MPIAHPSAEVNRTASTDVETIESRLDAVKECIETGVRPRVVSSAGDFADGRALRLRTASLLWNTVWDYSRMLGASLPISI